MFPDACFLYVHREPLVAIDSKIKFVKIWQQIGRPPSPLYGRLVNRSQSAEPTGIGYFWDLANRALNLVPQPIDALAMARDHLEASEEALSALESCVASNRRALVDYDSLVSDPTTGLKQLWSFLHLPDETESILEQLAALGMPLERSDGVPRHIPPDQLGTIRELSQRKLTACFQRLRRAEWTVIGSIAAQQGDLGS
jgi:hypothetical protein